MLELLFSSSARVKVLALFVIHPDEISTRAGGRSGLVTNILDGPKLFLKGDEDGLRRLVGREEDSSVGEGIEAIEPLTLS